jgi:hypothetical protein
MSVAAAMADWPPCRAFLDGRWHLCLLRPDYKLLCSHARSQSIKRQYRITRPPGWYVEVYSETGGGHRVIFAGQVEVGGRALTDTDLLPDPPTDAMRPAFVPPPPPFP